MKVRNSVFDSFEYLFERGRTEWMPVFDEEGDEEALIAPEEARPMLASLHLVPQEDLHGYRVRELIPADAVGAEGYLLALREFAPELGSFVMFSLRRRNAKSREKRGRKEKGNKGR